MNKKTLLIISVCAVIALAIVAVAGIALVKNSSPDNNGDTSNNSSSKPKGYKGKVVCLPKKGDGPQTLECAYGIQTTDGKYYAVKDGATTPAYKNIQEYPTDSEVVVTGTVTAPSSDQHYDIAGVIEVTNIRAVE